MNFNALDLNLIRVFDALMQERSVTRAGDRIGLSQPAVSAALSRLRHVFNDNLFARRGHEMLPTPRALELSLPARRALAELETMARAFDGLEAAALARTFTLLGADFFSTLLMPHLARQIQQRAPRVKMRFLDSARGDVARLLLENTIDLALERPTEPQSWMSSELLFVAPFVIIAAGSNPATASVADGDVLPLEILCALPHALRSIDGSMTGLVDEALAARGLARNVTLTLPHFHGLALAVSGSDHIAAVPVQFASKIAPELGLRQFRPPVEIPAPPIRMYWHSRHDKDAAHGWMRGQIVEAVAALGFPEEGARSLSAP